jgi:hypothetical protein
MVRRMAAHAVVAFFRAEKVDDATRADAWQVAAAALGDPNLRVRREGITLATRLDAPKALELATAAYTSTAIRATQERPDWGAAIATDDEAFAEYLRAKLPGGDELLLAVAAQSAAPELAGALKARLLELDKAYPGKLAAAVIRQGDPALSRELFKHRDQLTPETAPYVAHALEHAFDAQRGGVMEDWDAWLKNHPDAAARSE